jgi:hypothetical protein
METALGMFDWFNAPIQPQQGGMFGGGPQQPLNNLGVLAALLQDLGANYDKRPATGLSGLQQEMRRLGDKKQYQDMVKGAIGTESPNTVMSTPSVFEPGRMPQVQAAKANDAQSMMFSGPMGQALGYEQSAAALPMLQSMDPQMGLPALMSMMGQAQDRQARKGERLEDRQWQVEDRTEARAQTVQDNAVRPATPEEKKRFGFRPETPLFMDGFGKPIPLQDPNAITPLQQQQLGIQNAQLGLQRQQLAASQAQAGDAALSRRLANAKTMSELQDKAGARQGQAASYDTAIATLERLPNHPGFSAAVGMGGEKAIRAITPWVDRNDVTPGTARADFMAEMDTFKAQTFLPMVAAMRGSGALSDAEGKKLTDAVGALSPDMSEEAFIASVGRIKADLERARSRASGSFGVPTQQQPANGGWGIRKLP